MSHLFATCGTKSWANARPQIWPWTSQHAYKYTTHETAGVYYGIQKAKLCNISVHVGRLMFLAAFTSCSCQYTRFSSLALPLVSAIKAWCGQAERVIHTHYANKPCGCQKRPPMRDARDMLYHHKQSSTIQCACRWQTKITCRIPPKTRCNVLIWSAAKVLPWVPIYISKVIFSNVIPVRMMPSQVAAPLLAYYKSTLHPMNTMQGGC